MSAMGRKRTAGSNKIFAVVSATNPRKQLGRRDHFPPGCGSRIRSSSAGIGRLFRRQLEPAFPSGSNCPPNRRQCSLPRLCKLDLRPPMAARTFQRQIDLPILTVPPLAMQDATSSGPSFFTSRGEAATATKPAEPSPNDHPKRPLHLPMLPKKLNVRKGSRASSS